MCVFFGDSVQQVSVVVQCTTVSCSEVHCEARVLLSMAESVSRPLSRSADSLSLSSLCCVNSHFKSTNSQDRHTHTHSQDAPQTCRGRPHNLVQSQDVPQEVLPRKQYNGAEPSGVSHLLIEGQHDQTDHLTLCWVCLQVIVSKSVQLKLNVWLCV